MKAAASCAPSLICCFNLMSIPSVISDQFRYVRALSSIHSQVGQRLSNSPFSKHTQSVSRLMSDSAGVHRLKGITLHGRATFLKLKVQSSIIVLKQVGINQVFVLIITQIITQMMTAVRPTALPMISLCCKMR